MPDNTRPFSSSKTNVAPVTRPTRLRHPKRPRQADTQPSPRDPKVWLSRAETASTLEDSLLYLNRALAINPYHRVATRKMDEALQHILSHNAFLGYIDESDSLYRVRTGANVVLHIPKDRAVPQPYPPKEFSPLRPAFRWLGMALLGLPLAGLGTLIGLLMALIYAVQAHRQPLNLADQVRANVVMTIAIVLAGLGFILTFLLLIHI